MKEVTMEQRTGWKVTFDYSSLEKFIAFSRLACIQELNVEELKRNFRLLQDKYPKILAGYHFDEENNSVELNSQITNLIQNKYLFEENNQLLYISMPTEKSDEIISLIDSEEKTSYFKLVNSYVATNMLEEEKAYQKRRF